LSNKYGVELSKIIAMNPQITDPNALSVGMKVKIPTPPKPVDTPLGEIVHKHVVVQGDTLWKLSKKWGIPLQSLVKANPQLKNPSVLLTGEVVNIPKPAADGAQSVPTEPGSYTIQLP